MTRGPTRGPNYTALDSNTPRFHPPSLWAVVPSEKRVCLQERPGEERQGPGQKTVLGPALFCMVAAVFFSPRLCLFFSLGSLPLWGRDGGRGADMMDGTGWRGARTSWGGPQGRRRMEGAQCRAPCLRGTCEAWGGPGWEGGLGPIGGVRFLFCVRRSVDGNVEESGGGGKPWCSISG